MSNLMSMLFPDQKVPERIWDVETLNFAWIDFFWSTMGRSGDVGKDVEIIYEKLQDKEALKKLLYNLADSLAKKCDLPGWSDKMESAILKYVFDAAVECAYGTERKFVDRLLSPDAEKGLWWYVNGPLRQQIDNECKEKDLKVPTEVTFVYNTGGWVVETVDPQPVHGGAMVLVDDNLNTVSIRMYNESPDPDGCAVRVEEATHGGEEPNPFFQEIQKRVNPGDVPWKLFSVAVARAIHVRAQNLRARINERK